jgi:hypothetical protein
VIPKTPPLGPEFSNMGRAVSVLGDTVVKIQEPEASRRERLRTLAGQRVGEQTGLFVVPEIVSFDDSRGEIVFQRLGVTALRQVISDPSRSRRLIGLSAEALAAIHTQMEPSDGATKICAGAPGFAPERNAVPLHGDFGLRNIFYLPGSDRIAIIDWANTDWLRLDADLGPPEIDIAIFLVSLFYRRLFGPWPVSRRPELARHFLTTYASASPYGLSLDTLRAVAAATIPSLNRQLRRRKGNLRALSYRYSMIDLEFFLRRLSQEGFAGPERNIG